MTTKAIPPAPWIKAVTYVGAAMMLGFGVFAFVAPQAFFDAVAVFEPYNPHFLRDIGAFQIGLGLVLLLAARPQAINGLSAALIGVGGGSVVHGIGHVMDRDLGGSPVTDIPTFLGTGIVLLVAGIAHHRAQSDA